MSSQTVPAGPVLVLPSPYGGRSGWRSLDLRGKLWQVGSLLSEGDPELLQGRQRRGVIPWSLDFIMLPFLAEMDCLTFMSGLLPGVSFPVVWR